MSCATPDIPTADEVECAIKSNRQPKVLVSNLSHSKELRYREYVLALRKQLDTIVQWPLRFEVNDFYGGTYHKEAYERFKADVAQHYEVQETVAPALENGETYHVYQLVLFRPEAICSAACEYCNLASGTGEHRKYKHTNHDCIRITVVEPDRKIVCLRSQLYRNKQPGVTSLHANCQDPSATHIVHGRMQHQGQSWCTIINGLEVVDTDLFERIDRI